MPLISEAVSGWLFLSRRPLSMILIATLSATEEEGGCLDVSDGLTRWKVRIRTETYLRDLNTGGNQEVDATVTRMPKEYIFGV